ncbi:Extended PHD (EPHD) domain,Zinc finger, RING/FYVE/PHD-type [Balamuthia mandrillaris]
MRKQPRENGDALDDHSLDITGLTVKWFEVNPKEMQTHKKTKREQVKTYQTKRKRLSPVSLNRQLNAALKPSLKLQPNGLQQHHQSSFCSKLLPDNTITSTTEAITTCLNETQKCYFCGQQQSNGMVGSLIMKQTQHVGVMQNIFIHENCLLWSSRYCNETDDQLILRVKMHSMLCSFCGYKRASIGCHIKDCRYVSHYLCAIASNGDWIDDQGFLCPFHIKLTKLANFKKMEWPFSSFSSQFHYIYNNSWNGIHQKELDMIAKYSALWESYSPCWHKQNLETKTQIVEIQSGHWAWSNELSKSKFVFLFFCIILIFIIKLI